MIHRASKLHLPTLRDAPSDAEALSHKLLVRGGFIRQVSAGLWTLLPLGWRVHRKVEQIVREEMDAIGAQEMFAPVLTPAELWIKSGRYGITELFKLQDRNGRDYVLPLTHEETFAFHAVELQSYRQLPQSWYHFQTKDRDEPRPRGGLLRVREFMMKDSYSFDRDEAGLDVSFQAHKGAYERILERCGLEAYGVQAESGMMGGSESLDFLAPSGSGENTLVTCENGDYAADLEIALGVPRAPELPGPRSMRPARSRRRTPDLRGARGAALIDLAATSKAMPVVKDDGTLVLALVRGDDRLEEAKLAGGARLRLPSRDRRGDPWRASAPTGLARAGRLRRAGRRRRDAARGPVRRRRESHRLASARRRGGARLPGRVRGHPPAEGGRRVPRVRRRARLPDRDRGRPHLQARHAVLRAARREVPRRGRRGEAARDGLLRDRARADPGGRGRATRRREAGIVWPVEIAPYDVHVVVLALGQPELGAAAARRCAGALGRGGCDVLLDDRELRPGEKFADADLIGCPLRVTVGKKTLEDGAVDVKDRASGEESRIGSLEIAKRVVGR